MVGGAENSISRNVKNRTKDDSMIYWFIIIITYVCQHYIQELAI